MADPADHAAATTAGYKRIQIERGASSSPRYVSTYEKQLIGEPGASGSMFRATGTSDVSQAAADTQALSALNGQRKHRYPSKGLPMRFRGSFMSDDRYNRNPVNGTRTFPRPPLGRRYSPPHGKSGMDDVRG